MIEENKKENYYIDAFFEKNYDLKFFQTLNQKSITNFYKKNEDIPNFSEIPIISPYKKKIEDITTNVNVTNSVDVNNSKNIKEYIDEENLTNCIKKFLVKVQLDEIEDGILSESEKYILEIFEKDSYLARQILSKVSIDYFSQPKILISILHILSGFDPFKTKNIYFEEVLLRSLVSHTNFYVQEQVLKVYENWANPKHIDQLKNISIENKWLKEYQANIISFLETLVV